MLRNYHEIVWVCLEGHRPTTVVAATVMGWNSRSKAEFYFKNMVRKFSQRSCRVVRLNGWYGSERYAEEIYRLLKEDSARLAKLGNATFSNKVSAVIKSFRLTNNINKEAK